MGEPLRVGLIGCGNVVGYGHRPALSALKAAGEVQLVALADITPGRREIAREWFGLQERDLYADYRDVLARDDVEAIAVTVPQQFRRRIVLDAFAQGKHVLSEKPIATAPSVARELVAAAEQAGLTLGMVHNYHYLPEYSKLHQLLGQGLIGDLRVLTFHYLGVIDMPGAAEFQGDWRHTLAAGGGILMDMIHAVYLAEWFYGAPAEQVMAFVDAPTYAARDPEVEDLALVQIAFPGGYAALHHGWGAGVGGVDPQWQRRLLANALPTGPDQRLQPGVRDLQRARLAAQRTRSRRPGGSGRQPCPLVHKAVVAIRRSCQKW